jgi:putative endonuclease
LLWNKANSREIGKFTEDIAAKYLQQQGLREVTRNFYCRLGEIDLIMIDKQTLVFIEVKYRKNANFGGALASISISKQRKLQKTATFYLQQQRLNAYNTLCRFDVVALEGNMNNATINWLKNAF